MLFAWLVVFHHVLLVASLKTSQPEDSQVGGDWDDDENDDVNDTYYQGEFEAAQQEEIGDRKLASDCGDCDFTFDVSCLYKRKVRGGFYHRLADCLVPSYGLLEEARKSLGKGKVCLVTSGRPTFFPAFKEMIDLDKFEQFTEGEACVQWLPLVSIDARSVKRAEEWYVKGYPDKVWPNAAAFLPIDLAANMKALHRDVAKIAAPVLHSSLVLVVRHSRTRAFTQKTWEDLRAAMLGIAASAPPGSSRKPTYVEYQGRESLLETVNMFVNAAGVAGYHGAGLVNALFAKQKSCVMEILPLDKNGQQWRSNDEIAHLSSTLVWDKLYIKFKDMMKANPSAPWGMMWKFGTDKFFKMLPWVELPDSGVADFKSQFSACLQQHVF